MKRLAAFATATATLLLAGCVTVDVGREPAAQTQYVLMDVAPAPARRATPVAAALLIQTEAGDPIADSLAIAYSRSAGQRAIYQLATWTDRPARRVPQLLQRRLEQRGSFGAIATLGQPLQANWLLSMAIDDIHHDVATEPGVARLVVRATLFDRNQRSLVAQRAFVADAPVAEARAAAAASAMNHAVAQTLDALVSWIEQEVERAPRRP